MAMVSAVRLRRSLAPGAAIIPPQLKSRRVEDSMSNTNHGCHHP